MDFSMSQVWAVIVSIIILMVIYGYVSAKISSRKEAKVRKQSLPVTEDYITVHKRYNVYLTDGKNFEQVEFVGEVNGNDGVFTLGGYEGMLVLKKKDGKKVYLKKTIVKMVEEV